MANFMKYYLHGKHAAIGCAFIYTFRDDHAQRIIGYESTNPFHLVVIFYMDVEAGNYVWDVNFYKPNNVNLPIFTLGHRFPYPLRQ
ncbi:MAG: hypothetical protein BGN87_14630 [Rhizobiales bacterium 65-79]|nr:MAG: hypothetical protein BGN87_14630 [Rhizobiales bacterium 65-79]